VRYVVIAVDEEGAPVAIGPLNDTASDALYEEIESWNWTASSSARVVTVAQTRHKAAQRRPGGQRRLNAEQRTALLAEFDAKVMSAAALARKWHISRATLYRLLDARKS
jgi:hypothetical protein